MMNFVKRARGFLADVVLPAMLVLVICTTFASGVVKIATTDRDHSTHTAVEQASAPEVLTINIKAVESAKVGNLIELDVGQSNGATFTWHIVGIGPENYRVIDNGRRVLLTSPRPGPIDVYVATARGDAVAMASQHIEITGEQEFAPEPTPKPNLPEDAFLSGLRERIEKIDLDPAAKRERLREISKAFKEVAVMIEKKAVTEVEEVITMTRALLKKAVSPDNDRWKDVIKALEDQAEELDKGGMLKTLEDHRRMWLRIADTIP